MIKIKNLNKYYNKNKENQIHVINDVTLELPDKGLISFLGPSGSGKTTLLNVIGGLDKAKGTIAYDELEIKDYKMRQVDRFRSKEIGYVFQNYNLLLEETVYSNLAIALEMIGIYDKEEQEKRIEYTLKAVGMYKYRKKRAYALSGGQQQRVSIARALIKKTKIIIADEPTGNLDSENTIEVMNILKKISKTSLVLLVTHNEEVANFYSDQVIKIQDGSIKNQYEGGENFALNTEQSNTIYLKDLNEVEQNGEHVNVKYYSTDQPSFIDLQIVEKNGTYYISSSVKLKLAEETNVKFIDDHYQALKQEHVDQFEYDTSWYQDSGKNKNGFKRFWGYLVKSFNKIRFAKRRTKILYACFVVIGILLAVCMISFSNYMIADDSKINADKGYDLITNDNYLSTSQLKNKYYDWIDQGDIENLSSPINIRANIYYKYNFSESLDYSLEFLAIPYSEKPTYPLLAGSAPAQKEMVISKKMADDFIQSQSVFKTYKDLIGIEIEAYYNWGEIHENCTISGVCDNPYIMGYMNEQDFLEYYFLTNKGYVHGDIDLVARNYEIESKYNTYEIVSGRDISKDSAEKEVLIASTSSSAEDGLGTHITIHNENYLIVGTFKFKNYETSDSTYIYNEKIINELDFWTVCNLYANYQLVEGREIQKSRECLVSVYSQYSIGDKIGNLVVVGKYYSNGETLAKNIITSKEAVYLENQSYYYDFFWFQTIHRDAIQDDLPNGFYIEDIYQYYFKTIVEDNRVSLLIFGILSLALLITISVFIYFIMRSRMIADIYPIGVYRSLGASKGRLYKQFVSDIFVTISFTSLIGYVGMAIIYHMLANGVNSMFNANVFKSNLLFVFLGIVVLYGLNFLFGLLPIHLLLRKTPAEIISKYDI